MSALDRDLAEALAAWAHRRRGWDKPGSVAALGKVKHRNADDVAMAWVRFCADPHARTPGAFPAPSGPHWNERVSTPAEGVQPPRTDEACQLCGRHTDRCICDTGAPVWRPDAPATEEARRHWAKEARAALRPTTGEYA